MKSAIVGFLLSSLGFTATLFGLLYLSESYYQNNILVAALVFVVAILFWSPLMAGFIRSGYLNLTSSVPAIGYNSDKIRKSDGHQIFLILLAVALCGYFSFLLAVRMHDIRKDLIHQFAEDCQNYQLDGYLDSDLELQKSCQKISEMNKEA